MLTAQLLRALLTGGFIFVLAGTLVVFWLGYRALARAGEIQYYLSRRRRIYAGWAAMICGVLLFAAAIVYAARIGSITDSVFPPSPTATITPTVTLTATITQTPDYTPTLPATPTPYLPPVVGLFFSSSVTPQASAQFSDLMFTQSIDDKVRPRTPGTEFKNPLAALYGVFYFQDMTPGVQWTALWWRGDELVHYETKPWDGSESGFAYTLWQPEDIRAWEPGEYRVQIFVGLDWKKVGNFTVTGEPATPTPLVSPTPSDTPTPTASLTPTLRPTLRPTRTTAPTWTRRPSDTPTSTFTPRPSDTPTSTSTPRPTQTPAPSATFTSLPSATPTASATVTPTPTMRPSPSGTPTPTRTSTATRTVPPLPSSTRTTMPTSTPRPTLFPWPK